MYVIVWRYEVAQDRADEFERTYGAEGAWAMLFREAPGFLRTELFRGAVNHYLTLDHWLDRRSFEEFRERMREEYEELDRRTEHLTLTEERIGAIED